MRRNVPFPSFLLLLLFVRSSTSCSIITSMNCSCYQSNEEFLSSPSARLYSHLHCSADYSNQNSFQILFGPEAKDQNRFRTLSFEFAVNGQFHLQPRQFDLLSLLFSGTDARQPVEISLRFEGFDQLVVPSSSFTSKVFQAKHRNKTLKLFFLPRTDPNRRQMTLLGRSAEELKLAPQSFVGLNLSRLDLYINSLDDQFVCSTPFEQIFNRTTIGEMHLFGSLLAPSSVALAKDFRGKISSLLLRRHAELIDRNSFPPHHSVRSLTIHSIGAHAANWSTFALDDYANLRQIDLLNPRVDVSIDEFFPQLKSLFLDVELLQEQIFRRALHIEELKLGSSLRRIDPNAFFAFPQRLNKFDLSDVDLKKLTPDSRCALIHYLEHFAPLQPNLFVYPRVELTGECHCSSLFIHFLDSSSSKHFFPPEEKDFCAKQCRFTDCSILSEFFRKKFPLVGPSNSTNELFPSIDLRPDQTDVEMLDFLHNQDDDDEEEEEEEEAEEFSAPEKSSTVKIFERTSVGTRRSETKTKTTEDFNWIFLSIVVVILFVVLGLCLCFLLVRCRSRRRHFKPVPTFI